MERVESLAAEIRSGQRVSMLPKGTNLARYCIALGLSKGDAMQALEIARQWEDTPAVSPGGLNLPWGSELAQYGIGAELIEALLPITVVGRMAPNMRKVPFRTSVSRETSVAASAWVEENFPIPAFAATFDLVTQDSFKCGSIVVLSRDLLRFSGTPNPNSEAVLRSQLVRGIARFLDQQFLDPAIYPIYGVRPGSVFWRADKVTSSGSTADQILADLLAMVAKLSGQGTPFVAPYFVMKPTTAISLAGKYTTAGTVAFPTLSAGGGTLLGIPVLTTANSPQQIGLVDASEVLLSDDGAADIQSSGEAAVQMSDTPTPGPTALVSLWQKNLFSLRAVREIAWTLAHNSGDIANSPTDYVPHGSTYMQTSF